MIQIINIKKTYMAQNVKTSALHCINLEIKEGEFVAITGKSGCGKSTLLNILGGMDTPTGGEYLFNGVSANRLKAKSLAKFRNETIGYIFQGFNLISEINIVDNVSLPLGYAGMSRKKRTQRSNEALKCVGLENELHKYPTQLSGGQQQRVAIARAIVTNPKVLLADEPTGNLDKENGKNILEIIKGLNATGTTVVMVTHDKEIAESAQRIINISDGTIVY